MSSSNDQLPVTTQSTEPATQPLHSPIKLLVGLVLLFVALMIFGAMSR
jgi:hypothetical protein